METRFRQNVPLAPYTTLRLGGPARHFCTCTDPEEVREAVGEARSRGLRLHVLGQGSNTVFLDGGFDGLVIRMDLRGVREDGDDRGGVALRAAAGEDWDRFVERTVRAGLAGVECLSGIPGSVGATPIQNVGAYGQEVSETIAEVEALDLRSLRSVSLDPRSCGFGYRTSRFKEEDSGRYLILAVTFRLRRGPPSAARYPELARALAESAPAGEDPAQALGRVRAAVLALRRKKGMVLDPDDPNTRSAGSFFTNPVLTEEQILELQRRILDRFGEGVRIPVYPGDAGFKVPAAWLIERAGFSRGYRRGGAAISERHTLALVNRGGTARELLDLAAEIAGKVDGVFGVRLRREPVVVGEPGSG